MRPFRSTHRQQLPEQAQAALIWGTILARATGQNANDRVSRFLLRSNRVVCDIRHELHAKADCAPP
jgi:hypothetical protein